MCPSEFVYWLYLVLLMEKFFSVVGRVIAEGHGGEVDMCHSLIQQDFDDFWFPGALLAQYFQFIPDYMWSTFWAYLN